VGFVEEFVGLGEGVGLCGRGFVRFEEGVEVGCEVRHGIGIVGGGLSGAAVALVYIGEDCWRRAGKFASCGRG